MTPAFIDHVVLEVADMDRSLAFYRDLLGLAPERLDLYRQGKAPFVSVRAGDTLIDLFPSAAPGPGPHHLCIAFEDSIADVVMTLQQYGIESGAPEPRFGARGMGLSVYVRDPDGHQIELRSYQNNE